MSNALPVSTHTRINQSLVPFEAHCIFVYIIKFRGNNHFANLNRIFFYAPAELRKIRYSVLGGSCSDIQRRRFSRLCRMMRNNNQRDCKQCHKNTSRAILPAFSLRSIRTYKFTSKQIYATRRNKILYKAAKLLALFGSLFVLSGSLERLTHASYFIYGVGKTLVCHRYNPLNVFACAFTHIV